VFRIAVASYPILYHVLGLVRPELPCVYLVAGVDSFKRERGQVVLVPLGICYGQGDMVRDLVFQHIRFITDQELTSTESPYVVRFGQEVRVVEAGYIIG